MLISGFRNSNCSAVDKDYVDVCNVPGTGHTTEHTQRRLRPMPGPRPELTASLTKPNAGEPADTFRAMMTDGHRIMHHARNGAGTSADEQPGETP